MVDKKALYDDLTKEFINYQHRLDCPMPVEDDIYIAKKKYLDNPMFRAKVKSLASGVMQILEKHL